MRPVGTEPIQTTSAGAMTPIEHQGVSRGASVTKPGDVDLYVGPRSSQKTPPEQPAVISRPSTPPEGVTLPDQAVLLYNSDCSVCRIISSWVKRNDEPANGGGQKIDERPIGYDPEALKKLNPNLDIWKAYETIHMVMPDGTIKTGGETVAEVLRRLPDTKWFAFLFDVSVFGWRPFQGLLNVGYTVLDRLRPALGCESCGTPPPWWGMPIAWAVKGYKKLFGKEEAQPPPTTTPLGA